ncbi:MAG TPA: hypothetical protein VIY48_14195 [Candidatus Paceibacterota bacterium]
MNSSLETLAAIITDLGFRPMIDEGELFVSAEYGDDAADYWGEFRGGYPWINPALEMLAREENAYWDWVNPGQIVLCSL